MDTRCSKLILLVVAFTLAVAPLRGAFALVDDAAGSVTAETHCDQMQGDMHPPEHLQTQLDQGNADPSGHDCEQGCGGSCCDGACTVCVHGVPTAMTGTLLFLSVFSGAVQNTVSSHAFPERSLPPPLHPPATLRS